MPILPLLMAFAPTPIGPPTFRAKEPQIAALGKRAFLVCGAESRIYVLASRNAGVSFGRPVLLPIRGNTPIGMRRGPRIAIAGKNVVVTVIVGQEGGGTDGDLLAWHSPNDGRTWSGPTKVSDSPAAAREGLHALAVSPQGRLACAWLDLRNKGTEIWSSTSDDHGVTWSKNVRVYRSPDETVCECCHPSVAFGPKGEIHVMFRNWLGGSRDMYLATSSDGGKRFAPAQKLGRGTWPLDACPMDGGMLAVRPDGTVDTVWRRGNSVFMCVPGRPELELGPGTQPWIDGRSVVWLQDGRLRTPDKTFTEATDPVVAPVGGRPLAVWADRSGRLWSQRL